MMMTFTNEAEGTQGCVKAMITKPGWYAVTLKDLDSGEVLPVARHVDNLDHAVKLAKEWANL
jgi:hypothetical protein